ncbi:hypothetical protein XENTR_v10009041 [Xenopus tropicalis]|uniref:Ribonuclease P protein subunit p25 n=1 Tax=Xenopus tropicalis TaxID=8364 RepID=A0A8J0T2P0_XENTR|nr:ribonuclease P protein subunit p25 [Xenopus tropicalis]KAE8617338.1 hypothetical protein XENTR_v10009041 [Xenopus tropicalis]KAE8617339.1 hypothetical protein XENTR_v10009041 [Xenopus tropicalis]KAE8617340.1 hypothetical protein XENTR_v10009041 [Xenopus tropicalis]
MENFRRVQVVDEDDGQPLPFKNLHPDVVKMRVKEGSKIRNLVGYAVTHMLSEENGQIVFSAYGRGVTKAVTCVEILKRKIGGLHQVTKVQYKIVQEVWEQKGPKVQHPAPRLNVQKNYPSINILLSKEPLDPQEEGYQPPQSMALKETGKRFPLSHSEHCAPKKKTEESEGCY